MNRPYPKASKPIVKNPRPGGGPSKTNPSNMTQKSGTKVYVNEQKNTPKREGSKHTGSKEKRSSLSSVGSSKATSKKSSSTLSSIHNFFHSGGPRKSTLSHDHHAKPKKSIMVHNTKHHHQQPEKKESFVEKFLKNPCECCCSPIFTLYRCCIIISALLIFAGLLKLIEFHDMPDHQLCVQLLMNLPTPYNFVDAERKCYTLKDAMIITIVFYTMATITAGVLILFATQLNIVWTVLACIGMLVFAVIMFITANAILCELATSRSLNYASNADRETAVNIERAIQIIQILIVIFLYIYFALCAWALKLRMHEEENRYHRGGSKKVHPEKLLEHKKAYFRNRAKHDQGKRLTSQSNTITPARRGRPRKSVPRKSVLRRSSSELQKYETIRRQKALASAKA